jgi:hypothetical protein
METNNVIQISDYRKPILIDTEEKLLEHFGGDRWAQRHSVDDIIQVMIDSGWISPNATYEVGNTFYDIKINPRGHTSNNETE